jgi:glycine betaine/choline ABC-type transport system substrate-binding protein
VACGGGGDGGGGAEIRANLIEENPENNGIEITVGSKNFSEQYILGDIYARALEAAGYDVRTDLGLGNAQVALRALERGEIDAYPEYTSTPMARRSAAKRANNARGRIWTLIWVS